jgi:hypothetical protein
MIGAMVGQLSAQTYSLGTVVVVRLGGAVPALLNPNVSWWGYPPRGWRAGRHGDMGFHDSGYASDPFYYRDDYPAQPSVVVVMPQVVASPTPPEQPPPPIQSETREYHWPSSGNDSSPTTFSIVSKNGRIQSASAVWVHDDTLSYITPDGREGRMPIDSIDREGTCQRNAQKELNFCLPAQNTEHLQVQFLTSQRQ